MSLQSKTPPSPPRNRAGVCAVIQPLPAPHKERDGSGCWKSSSKGEDGKRGTEGKPAGSGFHSHHLPREAFLDEEQVKTLSPQGRVTWERGPAGSRVLVRKRERGHPLLSVHIRITGACQQCCVPGPYAGSRGSEFSR